VGSGRRPSFATLRRRGAHDAFDTRPQVFARRRVGSDPGSSLRGVGRVAQRTRFPVRCCRRFRIRASNPRGITALRRRTSPVSSGRTFRRCGIEPVRPAPGTPAGLGSTRPEGYIAVVPARIDRLSREQLPVDGLVAAPGGAKPGQVPIVSPTLRQAADGLINPFYPGPLRGRSRGWRLAFSGRHPLRRRGGREGHGSEGRSRAADNRPSEAVGSWRRHGRPVSGWRILGLRGLLFRTPDFGSGRFPGGRFRAARRFHLAEKEGQKLTREVGVPGGPPRMTAGRRLRGPE
jgi:hypothetical protein